MTDPTLNPPGAQALHRRVATHAVALERMRESLGAPGADRALRALSRQSTDDPAIAVLDVWAYVADVVAFYCERIANEGYLRTATRTGSVRELARMIGYELRPGVAAQLDLAFYAETTAGAPESVAVLAGTPAQSIPRTAAVGAASGPPELPQTFETADDLEVRGVWNEIAAIDSRPQTFPFHSRHVWLRGATTSFRPGDDVLIVGAERATLENVEKWDFRVVQRVELAADGRIGWVRLNLDRPIGYRQKNPSVAERDVTVHSFGTRGRLFGWNAPDPSLLVTENSQPDGVVEDPDGQGWHWDGFGVADDSSTEIELDGDHAEVAAGSWLVLEQPGDTEAYLVQRVRPDGIAKFALSGPITLLRLDLADRISAFQRRRATVHCGSTQLPAGEEPDTSPLIGGSVVVAGTDPPLPTGRRVLLSGTDTETGEPVAEPAVVDTCTPSADGTTMELRFTADLTHAFARQGLTVLANVVAASHGESAVQVLGSGDGQATFAHYRLRLPPLTYLRALTPEGSRAELTVRVDGVAWTEVPSLEQAGPADRVYVVHRTDDGGASVVLGDGVHGARPSTGVENITAAYRVGLGRSGAVAAGQVSLLPRRALGVRRVLNPAAAGGWADAEPLETARANAPLRVRTLDRVVSVADHEDFARGYGGVGPARADRVWDGRHDRVAVTVLDTVAAPLPGDFLTDLSSAIRAVREDGMLLEVTDGEMLWFGLRVEVLHDPAYVRDTVVAAVITSLAARFAAPLRPFATAVTAADALLVVRSVPGVAACTMPRLLPLATVPLPPELPPDSAAQDPFLALPARWDGGLLPAQLAALATGGVEVGVMT